MPAFVTAVGATAAARRPTRANGRALNGVTLPLAAGLLLLLMGYGGQANRNAVGQLPVMGWSGYLAFMQHSGHCDKAGAGGYNETTFVQTMDALKASGLAELG